MMSARRRERDGTAHQPSRRPHGVPVFALTVVVPATTTGTESPAARVVLVTLRRMTHLFATVTLALTLAGVRLSARIVLASVFDLLEQVLDGNCDTVTRLLTSRRRSSITTLRRCRQPSLLLQLGR